MKVTTLMMIMNYSPVKKNNWNQFLFLFCFNRLIPSVLLHLTILLYILFFSVFNIWFYSFFFLYFNSFAFFSLNYSIIELLLAKTTLNLLPNQFYKLLRMFYSWNTFFLLWLIIIPTFSFFLFSPNKSSWLVCCWLPLIFFCFVCCWLYSSHFVLWFVVELNWILIKSNMNHLPRKSWPISWRTTPSLIGFNLFRTLSKDKIWDDILAFDIFILVIHLIP